MNRWARVMAAAGVLAALCLPATASAWAPADSAKVHPGVMTVTKGAQCTANFVFRDRKGRTFLGQAAHCSGKGESSDTNGCKTDSLPLGTRVRIEEADRSGRLAYSSWIAMHKAKVSRRNPCEFNDFALIRLRPKLIIQTNPSLPYFGGPSGTGPGSAGDDVYSWGNSSLRGGNEELSPRRGSIVRPEGGRWSYEVQTDQPGVPGDSGSGFLNSTGQALGVLSTIRAGFPSAVSNGVGDMRKALRYARRHSRFKGLRVVKGTEEFNPNPPLTALLER